MFSNGFYENRAFYEKLKNTVEPGRLQMTIWRMCITCWIPKATNALSEYVIPIEFPLQLWLQERASMLRNEYNACWDKILNLLFGHEQGCSNFLRNFGNFKNFYTVSASKLSPEAKRPTGNSKVSGSGLGWDTKYPD
jgi:hypothetical protein